MVRYCHYKTELKNIRMLIKNKQQYYQAMAEVEGLYLKGFSKLTRKEENHLSELADAIEVWELIHYPMPINPTFSEIINYILSSRKITQLTLAQELNISTSFLNHLLHGIKSPNATVLKSVHMKYEIDGNLLLESLA